MTIDQLKQTVENARTYLVLAQTTPHDPATRAYCEALVQLHDTVEMYVRADEGTAIGAYARERFYEQLYQLVLK